VRSAVFGLLVFTASAVPALAQQQAPAVVPVGTVVAERRPVSKSLDFVGRVDAINRVEVKARITGFLEAVLFKEGDIVKEGDPLYRIEKGQFEAAVKQAQGTLERSKAAKVLSTIQLQRAEELLARNTGTAVARDQAFAADQQAAGQILSDEATLQTAQINLGYTEITAPIAGKVGRTALTKGNVVGPDSGRLTVIVSQDPMYVTFPVSERELMRAKEAGQKVDLRGINVRIRFADGTLYDQTGQVDFVDVTVDRSTDTVIARAVMPNPAGSLTDGQLVRVALETGKPEEKIVVPQAALIADQEGIYVFVVDDGKVAVRRLKVSGELGPDVIVEDGLKGGELIIVEGLQSIRPGAPVRAAPLPKPVGRN